MQFDHTCKQYKNSFFIIFWPLQFQKCTAYHLFIKAILREKREGEVWDLQAQHRHKEVYKTNQENIASIINNTKEEQRQIGGTVVQSAQEIPAAFFFQIFNLQREKEEGRVVIIHNKRENKEGEHISNFIKQHIKQQNPQVIKKHISKLHTYGPET